MCAKMKISLYICFSGAIMMMAFLCGLEKAPTFLVPIINPPFADNSPHLISGIRNIRPHFVKRSIVRRTAASHTLQNGFVPLVNIRQSS
jgi:hypothetical protein